MNRHTKTSGGITGFSLRPGTVQRWLVTVHDRAAITQCCQEAAGLNKTESLHKQLQSTRIRKDEDDVKSLTEMLRSWGNPFDECIDGVVNLASDVTA